MSDVFQSCMTSVGGVPTITPQDLQNNLKGGKIIDVRRPDEFVGELGHVPGASLMTLESELESGLKSLPKDATYVFVCRSGGRSGNATQIAQSMGFKSVYNMKGGMLAWNEFGFSTEK